MISVLSVKFYIQTKQTKFQFQLFWRMLGYWSSLFCLNSIKDKMKQILLTKLAVLILTVSVTSNFKVDVTALREWISVIVKRHEYKIKDELAAFGVSLSLDDGNWQKIEAKKVHNKQAVKMHKKFYKKLWKHLRYDANYIRNTQWDNKTKVWRFYNRKPNWQKEKLHSSWWKKSVYLRQKAEKDQEVKCNAMKLWHKKGERASV